MTNFRMRATPIATTAIGRHLPGQVCAWQLRNSRWNRTVATSLAPHHPFTSTIAGASPPREHGSIVRRSRCPVLLPRHVGRHWPDSSGPAVPGRAVRNLGGGAVGTRAYPSACLTTRSWPRFTSRHCPSASPSTASRSTGRPESSTDRFLPRNRLARPHPLRSPRDLGFRPRPEARHGQGGLRTGSRHRLVDHGPGSRAGPRPRPARPRRRPLFGGRHAARPGHPSATAPGPGGGEHVTGPWETSAASKWAAPPPAARLGHAVSFHDPDGTLLAGCTPRRWAASKPASSARSVTPKVSGS